MMLGTPASKLLDVLRGTAALLVVAGHSREYASRIFQLNPTGNSLVEKVLLVPSSFAMESVAVFFVLSGFLVGGQIVKDNKQDTFSWTDFLVKRISRLWTVLIPGLLFTWLVWEIVVTGTARDGFGLQPTLVEGFYNAIFMQEVVCPPFANNAALWSISYEFWFYLVFAAGMISLFDAARGRYKRAMLNCAVVVASTAIFGLKLYVLIPAWLVGVAIAWLFSESSAVYIMLSRRAYVLVALSIFAITLFGIVSNLLEMSRAMLTAFMAIPAALYVMSALTVKSDLPILRRLIDYGAKIGQWSFSIYVYHLPIVIAILYTIEWSGVAPRNLPLLTYLTLIATVPFTIFLWWLTERRTGIIRKALFTLLRGIRARQAYAQA